MYVTDREGPAHVRSRVGGAGFCTAPCGPAHVRYRGGASVRYRLGGAGSCTAPIRKSRPMYVTVWEEPAHVRYHTGGADSGRSRLMYMFPRGMSRRLYVTV